MIDLAIREYLKENEIDGIDMLYTYSDGMEFNEFLEAVQQLINETDVIYYSTAMDYLSEHDVSLKESLGLASELGYSLDGLSSEVLATLLKQQNLNTEFSEMYSELEELFY